MEDSIDISEVMPEPPTFTEEQVARCKETGDYRPILFEWYKFAGALCGVTAHIQADSEACAEIPILHYQVLSGLLNRCSRLMVANVALSHEGRFGEATVILDRCIFESAVKVIWLTTDPTDDKFKRYLADGLKAEVEMRDIIEQNAKERGGQKLVIEERMLKSIDRCLSQAGLTQVEVKSTLQLPDLMSMLSAVGLNRLMYVSMQKMGSHHIHGTWPSLLFHYLDEKPGSNPTELVPSFGASTHANQYIYIPMMVLSAMIAHVKYALKQQDAGSFERFFQQLRHCGMLEHDCFRLKRIRHF